MAFEADTGPRGVRRRDLALLAVVTAFGPLSMDLYLPGLPNLRRDFAVSASTAQLTVTACICGLALGQLFAGAVSDARGRRGPVLVGMAVWCATTVACAAAPSIGAIIVLRCVQGLGAGVCLAVARAVLADLDPVNLMRHMSRMLLVLGAVPVLAPSLGGVLLSVDGWRGLFLLLAATGAVFAIASLRMLPESLPRGQRNSLRLGATLRSSAQLIATREFALPALVSGAAFGALFSYLSSSPFILRNGFGLTATEYGLAFGLNAAGLIAGMQASPALAARLGPRRAQLAATVLGSCAAAGLFIAALAAVSLPFVLMLTCVVLAATGVLIPAASTEAMSSGTQSVGAASGLVGSLQFAIGGLTGVIGALFGAGNGLAPLAVMLVACHVAALSLTMLRRIGDRRPMMDARAPKGTPALIRNDVEGALVSDEHHARAFQKPESSCRTPAEVTPTGT
jgi:DHA1 family bicyclomycin/chloramphenicol resistance-like MFS transporter